MLLFLNESKLMMIVMIVMMIVMTVMIVIMKVMLLMIVANDVFSEFEQIVWGMQLRNKIFKCQDFKIKTRVELINFINDVFVRWVSQVLRRETGFWPALSSQPSSSSSSSTKSQIICSIRQLSQKNICPEMLVTSCDDVGADNITIILNNDAAAADSDDDAGSILCWGKYLPQKRNYFIYFSLTLPNRIIDLV